MGALNRELVLHMTSFPKPGRPSSIQSFAWVPGGSAFHTAAALVRLQVPTGVLGRVGRDANGRALLREISKTGIFTRHVQKDPDEPTALSIMPVTPDGQRTLMIARGVNDRLDKERARQAVHHVRHLHVSGSTLLGPETRAAVMEVLQSARQGGLTTSLDFSPQTAVSASPFIREALAHVTVVLASAAELRLALGLRQLSRAAEAAHELGALQIAARLGAGGCRVFSVGRTFRVPPFHVRNVGVGGAVDAFKAGYIFGLLHEANPEACGVIANAAEAAAARSEPPHESLGLERLVDVLREGEKHARRKTQVDALRKAIELLPSSGNVRRKALAKSRKPPS